jgi:hypothetical protein
VEPGAQCCLNGGERSLTSLVVGVPERLPDPANPDAGHSDLGNSVLTDHHVIGVGGDRDGAESGGAQHGADPRAGSASENWPGSSGPGIGGSDPVTSAGMSIHSLPDTPCQQANDSAPPGQGALRTLAKAATGSVKNITPKRE